MEYLGHIKHTAFHNIFNQNGATMNLYKQDITETIRATEIGLRKKLVA